MLTGNCPLILYPFIAGSWIPREQAASTNLWAKNYTHLLGCQKSGAFQIRIKKNRVSHILFVEKRGLIIYLAVLKKGAIRHAHPYYVIVCHSAVLFSATSSTKVLLKLLGKFGKELGVQTSGGWWWRWWCVCVGAGGGGGRGGVTSYIWHSTDVRTEWPPFFSAARYMIGPLFSTKSIWMTRFFWIPMWKAPLFWHPGICIYFMLIDFFRLLVLLVFNELTAIFV